MEKYRVYAEDETGKRRFIDNAVADNGGRGLFDLYADECDDEEQIVIVLDEPEVERDIRTIEDLDGGRYSYDNNSPITLINPWSGAQVDLTPADGLNLDLWSSLMDEALVDHLHSQLAPCTDWDFVRAWSELVTTEEASRVILGS